MSFFQIVWRKEIIYCTYHNSKLYRHISICTGYLAFFSSLYSNETCRAVKYEENLSFNGQSCEACNASHHALCL